MQEEGRRLVSGGRLEGEDVGEEVRRNGGDADKGEKK